MPQNIVVDILRWVTGCGACAAVKSLFFERCIDRREHPLPNIKQLVRDFRVTGPDVIGDHMHRKTLVEFRFAKASEERCYAVDNVRHRLLIAGEIQSHVGISTPDGIEIVVLRDQVLQFLHGWIVAELLRLQATIAQVGHYVLPLGPVALPDVI